MSGFLLRNARLVDVAGAPVPPDPVDVVVRDGRVAAVGPSAARADGPAASGLPALDADGRWLIPGLWDQHVHLGQWALGAQRLDLGPATSVAEALAAVRARLAASDGPVFAWGHRPALWPQPPTVAALDAVSGDRPVVLIAGDGHHAWLNTAALDALGLPRRDTMVEETEWFAHYPRLSEVLGEDGTSPAAYLAVQRDAAARGVVGVVDLEFGKEPRDWVERSAAGGRLLRIRAATYAETLGDFLQAGLRTGDRLGEDPLVTMGPLKIISDGSLNTRTAWCCAPYADLPTHGAPNLSEEALHDLVATAVRHGLEVATHAIGDAAVSQALGAYAATGATGSIEHAQLVRREDVPRMAALGVRASVQPAHLLDDRDTTQASWPDRTDRCFTFRTMLDHGVTLALGSDAPVAPLDPWLAMAAAVHRSADERPPWHGEEAITAREALACSVDGRGSVHPGMPADLALLDADPLQPCADTAATGRHLRSMTAAATWVAGDLVHATAWPAR